jgi:hypothetical protein
MGAPAMRRKFDLSGAGVTVGILSDSYNAKGGAGTDVTNGDLPGVGNPDGYVTPVTVLQDYSGGEDEGRAILQIVHRVAPGSPLAFASAFLGMASFANNILNLFNTAGARVIDDDIFYYAEPMFQDGVIAQAVDSVVVKGASYLSSAGNFGREAYESAWRTGPLLWTQDRLLSSKPSATTFPANPHCRNSITDL